VCPQLIIWGTFSLWVYLLKQIEHLVTKSIFYRFEFELVWLKQ